MAEPGATPVPPANNLASRRRPARGLWVAAYFCLLATILFATQFVGTGFGEEHYGWVSSHGLSIAGRATPANGFVGHARTVLDADGELIYVYFDRYPPFFSAALGALTGLTTDLRLKVWLARQAMLVLFVLTMTLAWVLLRRLGLGRRLALLAVTLAFSGQMLLYYRELVHFDQPALLGMTLLLTVIARAQQQPRPGSRRRLTLVTLLALSLGRSLVSWSVLGLWFLLEAAHLLWQRERPLAQRLRAILRHDATRMLLLGAVWSALLLGYNIAQEMARRDVPPGETSIVASMQRRLPGGEAFEGYEPDYDRFTTRLERRLLRWYLPLDEQGGQTGHRWLVVLALACTLGFCVRQPPPRRIPLLLTAFSGLVWSLAMINLAYFHDYTTMHALGFALVFWLALLHRLRSPRLVNALLLLGFALFLRANLEVEARHRDYYREMAVYTEEYNHILQRIGSSGQMVYSSFALQDDVVNDAKYVLSFYLADNVLTDRPQDARYIVSSRPLLALPTSLSVVDRAGLELLTTRTPQHRVAHLFDREQAERRALPPDLAPRFNFGAELALGHWELRDSVRAQPCQRIQVESWWQALAPSRTNFDFQLLMTAADGAPLASTEHNLILENKNTDEWTTQRWYLDLRELQIPCDAPSAPYSLLFTVYDPESNALNDKLPLLRPDGSPGDTWLYLTTLFVD